MQKIKLNNRIKAKYIGRALRKARRNLNMGRTLASQCLGISRRDLYYYEFGGKVIPSNILIKIFQSGIENLIK